MFDELPRKVMQIEDKVMMFENSNRTLERTFNNTKYQLEAFQSLISEKITTFERSQDP
jgi:archaellum component FlaC